MPKSPSFENVLPSPAPSEEHRHETICVIDLEDGDETISDSRAISVADEAARVRLNIKCYSKRWPTLISSGRVLDHIILATSPPSQFLTRFEN